jgi:succinoglycan biosynthesis protein ExoA
MDTAEVVRVTGDAYDRTTTNQPFRRESSSSMPNFDELVTVVVPARNEEISLPACLRSISAQTWPNLQIVVVDGASRDRTVDVVHQIQSTDRRVELVHNPNSIIPVSMNMALAVARGRWLVRVDAHSTIPPDYVATAVALLHSGDWGGVGGRKDGVGETAAGRAIAAAMGSRFGVGNSTYHYGDRQQAVEHIPFGCYPVDLLRKVGGWDEELRVNQDFELDYRLRTLGKRLLFDPSLVIRWQCQQRVPDLYRQYKRYGAGKFRVAMKHPRSVRARHLAAPGLVAALAVAAAAAPRRPGFAAGLALPYAAALAAATVTTARRLPDLRSRPWVAPAFAAMHFGWGIGFWSAAVAELRSRTAHATRRREPGAEAGMTPGVTSDVSA